MSSAFAAAMPKAKTKATPAPVNFFIVGCSSASRQARLPSVLRDVDIDSFEIGEMELADRALLEHLQPRLAFRSIAERLRHHQRVGADDFLHIALDGVDALDLEAEMLEPRRLRIMADEVFHLPRHDQERHPAVAEAVIAVAALVGDRKLVNGGVEFGAALGVGGAQR